MDESDNGGGEPTNRVLREGCGVGGICSHRYGFASDEGASLSGSRECCLNSVHLLCGEVKSFVKRGAGSYKSRVVVAPDISSFVFDEARAGGAWEADRPEQFSSRKVIGESVGFLCFHHATDIKDIFVGEGGAPGLCP